MLEIPDHPIARFVNLWFNVGQALRVPWLQLPRSIGGDLWSLAAPQHYETELSALQSFDANALGTVLRATGIGWPIPGQWFAPLASGPLYLECTPTGPNRDERWFFLNGICTDHRIAQLNARLLTQVFDRPVSILYNATEGVWLDLVECAIGKAWDAVTDAASANLKPLMDALCNPAVKRVILVCHSQGTIVAAVLLKTLEELLLRSARLRDAQQPLQQQQPPAPTTTPPNAAGEKKISPERRAALRIVRKAEQPEGDTDISRPEVRPDLQPEDIGKLELYCFANCATSMEPFVRLADPHARVAPWIESYGNENDLVAKLGLLAPPHGIGSARIAGDRYRIPGAWGHLFNAHYGLPLLVHHQPKPEPFHDNLRDSPRLLEYLHGAVPRSLP